MIASSSRQRVVIYGAGNEGRIVYDILNDPENRLRYEVIGFRDDTPKVDSLFNLPVRSDFRSTDCDSMVLAIGNDLYTKLATVMRISEKAMFNAPAISSSAYIAHDATIADSVIVHPRVVVMTNASIAKHAIVRTGATIDHDCVLEEFVNISPGVVTGGNVTIECGAFVGLGAIIFPGITIGKRAIVGAGAVVRENVGDDEMVVGNPAKFLRKAEK